jgi:hypothetical protein
VVVGSVTSVQAARSVAVGLTGATPVVRMLITVEAEVIVICKLIILTLFR